MNPLIESLKGKLIVSCQAYMGEPLRHPETMAQMARAAELLRGTSATVGAVAGEVGYQSQSAFIAMFAKWSGLSPSRYRAIAPLP